jgi:hypothetical protein
MAIDGDFDRKSLSDLRDTIRQAARNHSGWPPFVNLSRAPYTPKPVDGAIECWVGPDNDGTYDRPAHHDFWRISPDGLLFTRRGYPEDGVGNCPRDIVRHNNADVAIGRGDPSGSLHQRSPRREKRQPHSFRELE